MKDKTKAEFNMADKNTNILFWIKLKFVFLCMKQGQLNQWESPSCASLENHDC